MKKRINMREIVKENNKECVTVRVFGLGNIVSCLFCEFVEGFLYFGVNTLPKILTRIKKVS